MAWIYCSLSPSYLCQGKALYLAAKMLEEEQPFTAWWCWSWYRTKGLMLNVSWHLLLNSLIYHSQPCLFPLLSLAQICLNMSAAGLKLGVYSTEEPHGNMTLLRFPSQRPPSTWGLGINTGLAPKVIIRQKFTIMCSSYCNFLKKKCCGGFYSKHLWRMIAALYLLRFCLW